MKKPLVLSKFTWKPIITGLALSAMSTLTFAANPVNGDDWLHVQGNQVVDANNQAVWLTGANWFGFNTTERIFHGLWSVNLESTLDSIASRGINILRVPISTELIKEWKNGIYSASAANTTANPNLAGANSLEVFDAFLAHARQIGLKVLLDVHSPKADNSGHNEPLWYSNDITQEDFYNTWEWITTRYAQDDTIIAVDIENEPHGDPWGGGRFAKWDNSTDDNNWKYACETAANRILDINPNLLVLCEGVSAYPKDGKSWTNSNYNDYHNTWWGGNLRGVKDNPVNLGERQSQLLYSPHDYGPLVSQQDWFYDGFTKDTLYKDVWKDNWLYIYEDNIAPLLIGEWGGFLDGGDNEKWMKAIRDLIVEKKLNHTFWAINPNSGDTGGLLNSDWTTWDEAKYALLKPALWANESGKFIGLDHQVPLGSAATGVSLGEHLGNLSPSVAIQSPNNGDSVLTNSQVTVTFSLAQVDGVNIYLNGLLLGKKEASDSVIMTAPSEAGSMVIKVVGLDADGNELSIGDSITLNAVDALPANPTISIVTPTSGQQFKPSNPIEIQVTLKDATGFKTLLDNNETIFASTSGQLTAPSVPGNYQLLVTALDKDQKATSAVDTLNISVKEPTTGEISCVIGSSNVWENGFVLSPITITNSGNSTINNWEVTINFNQDIGFTSGWNAVFNANGKQVLVSNNSSNGTLTAGQSLTFGFQGTHNNNFSEPSCAVSQ